MIANDRELEATLERIAWFQKQVAHLTDHMARLKSRVSALPMRIIRWGLDCCDLTKPMEPFAGSLPKPPRSGSPREAVEVLRKQIIELRVRREQIALAPIPAAQARQIARRWVEDQAERGAIDVSRVIASGQPPQWPMSVIPLHGGTASSFPLPDVPAALAWLFADDLVERLNAEIDARADDHEALTPQQRTEREAEIVGQILTAERLEEIVISNAESGGDDSLLRRDDMDPRACLMLSSDLPPPQ